MTLLMVNGSDEQKLMMLGTLAGVLVFAVLMIAAWRLVYDEKRAQKERREKYRGPRRQYKTSA